MALPNSGPLTLNQIHVEAGGSPGTTAALNDSDIRGLIGKGSGAQMAFNEWYGASAEVNIPLTISGDTANYNIYSNRGPTYDPGKSNITLTINPGVTVSSNSTPAYALDTGSGWNPGDSVTVVNNGTIKGMGGAAGDGIAGSVNASLPYGTNIYPTALANSPGDSGGQAFQAQYPVTFTNNGSVYGGGGGGGGGGGYAYYYCFGKLCATDWVGGGAGGGGAGVATSSAGVVGFIDQNPTTRVTGPAAGGAGTANAGGAGGDGFAVSPLFPAYSSPHPGSTGGAGGGLGSAGSAGSPVPTPPSGTPTTPTGWLWGGAPTNGSGGATGRYQTGSAYINGGSGVGGTYAGGSS